MAHYEHALSVFDIAGTYLKAKGYALHLVFRILPAGAVFGIVELNSDSCLLERRFKLARLVEHALFVLCYGNDYNLDGCYLGRKHKSVVVAVRHNNRADKSRRHAPRGLVRNGALVFFIRIFDTEGFCKAVAEIVRRTCLKRLTVMHKCLDSISGNRACKLVAFGLLTLDNGHSESVFAEIGVDVKHSFRLFDSLLCRRVNGMALLPQEFS